jgi:hypothetical protein
VVDRTCVRVGVSPERLTSGAGPLPTFVASVVLARASPRVFERIALGDELSGTHRDSLSPLVFPRGLGLRLGSLVINRVNEIRVRHDLHQATSARSPSRARITRSRSPNYAPWGHSLRVRCHQA